MVSINESSESISRPSSLAQSEKKATKWNNISNTELKFRVCFVDIAGSIATE